MTTSYQLIDVGEKTNVYELDHVSGQMDLKATVHDADFAGYLRQLFDAPVVAVASKTPIFQPPKTGPTAAAASTPQVGVRRVAKQAWTVEQWKTAFATVFGAPDTRLTTREIKDGLRELGADVTDVRITQILNDSDWIAKVDTVRSERGRMNVWQMVNTSQAESGKKKND